MTQFSRLYQHFHPNHYTLSLTMQREKRRFHGVVTIEGESFIGGEIHLHAKDLSIDSATIDGHAAKFEHGENDELRLSTNDLQSGNHTVLVEFHGEITDNMHGLYPCYYEYEDEKRELIATQFESHHAREVFPCIDEPEAKATFDLALTTESEVSVLSNMPQKSSKLENGKQVTRFLTTPRMSSYLLAWVYGDLQRVTKKTKRGIDVSIYATPSQNPKSLDFALEFAADTIDFYEEYFGVEYPLPKSDHVALPDFSSGAMENWGLITYRESALLADPEMTGVSGKHMIASVIAHELAHQWFGNLVTMRWWDNLWLNESFADFVEHIAVDALHPEWNTWLDFVLSRGIGTLRRDAVDGVQSVQVEVHHPDEISTLFDPAIVYGKGARLMNMLRNYIGDSAFRAGLKRYFEIYAYKNTEGENLWDCLSEASGKDIAAFMNAWILQPGYPVVHVSRDGLRQEQFFIGAHQESTRVWPILLSAEPKETLPAIFDTPQLVAEVDIAQRLNSGDRAHFIADYSPEHLNALLQNVANYPIIDRLNLLHDQTLLVRGGYQPSTVLIDLLDFYREETNDDVWNIMNLTLSELKKFVETDEAAEKQLRALSKTVAVRQYGRLGFEPMADEPITDTKLRATALAMMLYGEDADVIDDALKSYESTPLEKLDPELRPLIMSAAVRFTSSESVALKLLEMYQKTPSAELRDDIAAAATATRNPDEATVLLKACLDSDKIRPQDVAPWFVYLLRNKYTRRVAWQWLVDNWQWIVSTFGGDKSYDIFPRYAAFGPMNQAEREEYRAFFEPKMSEPALKRAITLGLSEIDARLALLESDGPAVREQLLKH